MSRHKTSRSGISKRGTVRYGWRKRKAIALKYWLEGQRRLNALVKGEAL